MRLSHAVCPSGFVIVSLFLAGCGGGSSAEIIGTVNFDGQPVEDGSIAFIPVDGKSPSGSGLIKAGKYTAKAPPGNMKVSFTYSKVIGKKKAYDTPDSPEVPETKEQLPEKYLAGTTSVQFEVKPGLNKKDWDLTSK